MDDKSLNAILRDSAVVITAITVLLFLYVLRDDQVVSLVLRYGRP